MGKAMSNSIKSKAKIIMNQFGDKLTIDFRKNKEFIKKMNLPLSKLTINLMVGYITRTLKIKKKEEDKIDITKKKDKIPTKKAKDTEIHK